MPIVRAQGRIFKCEHGANLRQVLMERGIDLYNDRSKDINCHGLATCGTCAVQVEGKVSEPNWRGRARRSLPPHDGKKKLRLACQTKVLGDITVTKLEGFWGQGKNPIWTFERTNKGL